MVGEGAAVLVQRALRAARVKGLPAEAGSYEDTDFVASGFSRKALERFLAIYNARLLNHTVPYDGIPAAVRAAGRDARLAVLTNKPAHATDRILEGLGLRTLFDDVIAGDGEWPRKPDPSSLQELMARAGATAQRTLVVGDSAIDHETARRADARCCLATYGFGYVTFPAERLTGSEWIVRTPAELLRVFDEFMAA
jgi:phosphoglycolate phosphatase